MRLQGELLLSPPERRRRSAVKPKIARHTSCSPPSTRRVKQLVMAAAIFDTSFDRPGDRVFYLRLERDHGFPRGINGPMFLRSACGGSNANGALFRMYDMSPAGAKSAVPALPWIVSLPSSSPAKALLPLAPLSPPASQQPVDPRCLSAPPSASRSKTSAMASSFSSLSFVSPVVSVISRNDIYHPASRPSTSPPATWQACAVHGPCAWRAGSPPHAAAKPRALGRRPLRATL